MAKPYFVSVLTRPVSALITLVFLCLTADCAVLPETRNPYGRVVGTFRDWATLSLASGAASNATRLREGIALAKDRSAYLTELMRTNPQQALALAVPDSILKRLPPEITSQLEMRISGIGDYMVLGAISAQGGPKVEPIQRFVRLNGYTYTAHVYGRRLGETSKFGIPLNGIAIGDSFALNERALRKLELGEAARPGKKIIDLRSAAEKNSTNSVLAELGGNVCRFGSEQQVLAAETRLEKLESTLGPSVSQSVSEVLMRTVEQQAAETPFVQSPNVSSPWTTGRKNILIIRVDFPDLSGPPEGLAPSSVQDLADTQIAPYYAKSSYGLTTITNTVSSTVYRMPQTAAFYATNFANDTLHADAENAASEDFTMANYDRIIVFFSSMGHLANSQITYGGLAQIGGPNVWCNGEFDFRVIAHELGHTYGLYHANLWQVGDGNPISPSGSDVEYGDDFDTMGANYANNQSTDFNPWFKNILGWVSDNQVLTISTSGTYRIYAFDHDNYVAAPGETLALKVTKDGTRNYWLSCRRDFTGNASLTNGVYIFWGYNYTRQSDLLDMTTPGNSDQDAALAVGTVFMDTNAGSGVLFHPVDAGGVPPNEYRDILIVFASVAPVFIQQPISQAVLLGQSGVFSVSVAGYPPPGYQWQRKPNGSSTWTTLTDDNNYAGSASSSLTVNATDVVMSGDQFRCIAADKVGAVTSSPPATLTVSSGLLVTSLPAAGGLNGDGTNPLFYAIATDVAGNIYVVDSYNGLVRKITSAGEVSTLAPSFFGAQGVAVDAASNVYVTDKDNQVIKQIFPNGVVTNLAGLLETSGWSDGTNSGARFNNPWGIAVDSATNLYVGDSGNQTIRKLTRIGSSQNWAVTTIAGLAGNPGSADGTNSDARFQNPAGMAVDSSGIVYVADSGNNTIRKLTPSGTNWLVTTIAGRAGQNQYRDGVGTNAFFYSPSGIAVDAGGNLYVADTSNQLVRKITPQGVVSTLAGSYFTANYADGFYTNAQFSFPYGVAVDSVGNIYVADTFNNTIRVGSLASVVVPTLGLSSLNDQMTLSWRTPIQPFALQYSTNLARPNWVLLSNPIFVANGRNYVTNIKGSAAFYRLKTP
jgi:sugar lactone lactonase YvrE